MLTILNYIENHSHIASKETLRGLVESLSPDCDFLDAWKYRTACGYPVSEMGYTRSDYDGSRWWNTCFPLNDDLKTDERAKEIDFVTNSLHEAFPPLFALGEFCEMFAEDLRRDIEYNLYYKGQYANYWIRCIIRRKDYNLYVHAIIPAEEENVR